MIRSGFIILVLVLMTFPSRGADEFSAKEKAVIYTNAIRVLNNYQTLMNQMGAYVINDIDKARSSSESLIELFVNRQVLIYNDLDPSHNLSEFYEAETYLANIILWYPAGLMVNLDLENAKVSNIMSHDENVYSIDILVNRSIYGSYLKQTENKASEELIFRIAFGLENKNMINFRIVGIRSSSSNYQIDFSKALQEINSEELNSDDLIKVQNEIRNILKDYTNILLLIGDPQEQASDKEFYKTSFLRLFENNNLKIYNDLEQQPETSLISVSDYLSSYISGYPEGIQVLSIMTDSLKFGKVIKAEAGNYYIYVDAEKSFSGKFKGKDEFQKDFALIFKFSFRVSGNTYVNFRITSIDVSSVNFFKTTPETVVEEKPVIVLKPVTRKGLFVSVSVSGGISQVSSPDLNSLISTLNTNPWNVTSQIGFAAGVGVSYYISDNISVKTGADYNSYSASYNLTGKYTNNILSYDINGSEGAYYKIIESKYDSLFKIKYLTLPVLVSFTSGKPGKYGIYAETGCKVSLPIKASYTNSGNYKTSGYYPSHPSVLQYLDWPELGFYNRESISETGEYEISGLSFSFYGYLALSVPLGYYSFINIGPEISIGLSDILRNQKKYVDIFGNSASHQPTKINTLGIRISLAYKL